jgi:hypothetical protein
MKTHCFEKPLYIPLKPENTTKMRRSIGTSHINTYIRIEKFYASRLPVQSGKPR